MIRERGRPMTRLPHHGSNVSRAKTFWAPAAKQLGSQRDSLQLTHPATWFGPQMFWPHSGTVRAAAGKLLMASPCGLRQITSDDAFR